MQTKRLTADEKSIAYAGTLIRNGEVVAFPTETVYGLGADATNPAAVDKIFQAKGRPSDNPLIVHIASERDLERLVKEIPDTARKLMDAFWPGPLTLIFPKKDGIPDQVTAGLDTVGIRMPNHPVARMLIESSGVPLAAPSANRSGRPSPTTAEHVLEDLDHLIAAVIDGGPAGVGVESTVVDITSPVPMILRPGGISQEQIGHVVGDVLLDPALKQTSPRELKQPPKSPGMKYTHYAPRGDMWIVSGEDNSVVSRIQSYVDRSRLEGARVGVLTTDEHVDMYRADAVISCGQRSDLSTVAAGLYAALRAFDQQGIERIYAESFPREGIGLAIMNRLMKAAGYRVLT
ncbi:threonylcarbamoyl-AMP synthase [Collibacillus ludicampi]|uniref:Threonylcarbamoyl-AMP synthase n=1 Tax=Collibacillus ludicampi TaxID=2771369 RepID=A0AAV4LDE6_9BACL|nr:L-threonylcarbamoyladenylate synthase [Collibacillus ludicampi]GIM45729.1 threonylcarbamoyl-AMP synthase [Collibacillus ludicampi]